MKIMTMIFAVFEEWVWAYVESFSNAVIHQQISDNSNPWTVFIETVQPDSGVRCLTAFDKDSDVLLFFKYYDPRHKRLHYCGHHYMHISYNVREYCNTFHILPWWNIIRYYCFEYFWLTCKDFTRLCNAFKVIQMHIPPLKKKKSQHWRYCNSENYHF